MKTIKYILYALTATFVLASCSDDIKYTPGEGEDTDCYGVYFPSQENAGDQELDPAEPTTLTFTACGSQQHPGRAFHGLGNQIRGRTGSNHVLGGLPRS